MKPLWERVGLSTGTTQPSKARKAIREFVAASGGFPSNSSNKEITFKNNNDWLKLKDKHCCYPQWIDCFSLETIAWGNLNWILENYITQFDSVVFDPIHYHRDQVRVLANIFKYCSGFYVSADGTIHIKPKFKTLVFERTENGHYRPHNEHGPAIVFAGRKFYFIHGHPVPWRVFYKKHFSLDDVVYVTPVVRRWIVDRVGGYQNIFPFNCKAEKTSSLWQLDGFNLAVFVDPNTKETSVLEVPHFAVRNLEQAAAWTFGMNVNGYNPEIET